MNAREDKQAIPVIFSTGSLYSFGLDRAYGWAAKAGYDGVEIMMDERWDTHQYAYLSHLSDRHGIPVLALHTPLYKGAWRLDPGETLVRSAGLAEIGRSACRDRPPASSWETTLTLGQRTAKTSPDSRRQRRRREHASV